MTKNHDLPLPQLLEMIGKYFECALSDNEEAELRSIIASTTIRHPSVDEARALMGFRRQQAIAEKTNGHSILRRYAITAVSAAAAVAVIAAVGISFMRHTVSHNPGTTCIAYVNGRVITDESAVIDLLYSDIGDFGVCADEMAQSAKEEIDEIFSDIEIIESQPPVISI